MHAVILMSIAGLLMACGGVQRPQAPYGCFERGQRFVRNQPMLRFENEGTESPIEDSDFRRLEETIKERVVTHLASPADHSAYVRRRAMRAVIDECIGTKADWMVTFAPDRSLARLHREGWQVAEDGSVERLDELVNGHLDSSEQNLPDPDTSLYGFPIVILVRPEPAQAPLIFTVRGREVDCGTRPTSLDFGVGLSVTQVIDVYVEDDRMTPGGLMSRAR